MNHYLTEAEQGKLLATIGQYRAEKAISTLFPR